MKTMLWKEFRENFKWALLALIGLALAEFYVLSSERQNTAVDRNSLTLTSSTFLLVTAFGCAAIGGFLGVIQVLPELDRDRWAALLHRPVPRSVIFFGKVVAGLALYLFATLLPFLAAIIYVATPGVFAVPFIPAMMLPGLSDICLGAAFYFVALLLCLHRGRWFGARGVVALSLLPIFFLHTLESTTFFEYSYRSSQGLPALLANHAAFLLPLAVSVLFLLAARGAMLGNGHVGPRARTGRIAFLLIVLLGAQTAIFLLMLASVLVNPPDVNFFGDYSEFEITQEGQPLLAVTHGEKRTVTDMSGHPVTDTRYTLGSSYQHLYNFTTLGYDLRHESSYPLYYNYSRNTYGYALTTQYSYDAKEIWYRLVRQNYFIGYDALSRLCVGICDRDGFKPPGARPVPFPELLHGEDFEQMKPGLYRSGKQLYAIDFSNRTMIPFFNAGNDTMYNAVNAVSSYTGDSNRRVVIALQNEIRFFDENGAPLLTLPYPHDPDQWGLVAIATPPDFSRLYIESLPSMAWISSVQHSPLSYLDIFDSHGTPLEHYSHQGEPFLMPPPSALSQFFDWFSPFGPALANELYIHFVPATVYDLFTMPPRPLDEVFLEFGILFITGTAFAVFAFLWARQVGFPAARAARWALFVFCFGAAGLLAFRLASGWPTCVTCPSCGKTRPAESDESPCCRQVWPPLPQNGTEIFDDLKTAGAS